jgi:hypothetical protein
MLVDGKLAEIFLEKYKAIMTYLNDGKCPDSIEEYAFFRSSIYGHMDQIKENMLDIIGQDFYGSIESGIFGQFAFLKRYKQGYILQHLDTGIFYQAWCLTTPLDELIEEYSIIETALIPYSNRIICDGLILGGGVLIGQNMTKELRDAYWAAKRAGELITFA